MPNFPFPAVINDESVQVDRDGAGRISVTRNRPGLHAHAFVIGDEQHAFYADTPATATRHAHAWAAKHRPGQPVEPVR
mgnify:FL=1